MNIDTQHLDDHQVRLTVEVETEPFESAKRRAAKKIARQIKIPGFRPGKAPYPVILRHVGEPTVIEDAIEIVVDDIYPKIIDESGIEPYGPGALEEIVSLDPLTFKFLVPLKATVELGDYQAIRKDYDPPVITEEQVEAVVNNLRERQAIVETVEREAEESDLVDIQLSGVWLEPTEDEDVTLLEESSYPVVIEPETADVDDEWPFPGFSRKIVGLSAGDDIQLEYDYPEDSPFEQFAGKKVEFNLSVEKVQSRTLPDFDDEFAQSLGDFETAEALRETIRENLEEEAQDEYDDGFDEDILEHIVGESTIKYPPQMLDTEVDHVIERLESTLARQGMDVDLYLKTREMDMEALREELTPVAETRVKKSLTLLEIADEEGITVAPDELEMETNRTLGELSQYMSEKDFKNYISERTSTQNLVGNIMMDMLIKKTQAKLRNIARDIHETETDEGEEGEAEAGEEAPPLAESAAETGLTDKEPEMSAVTTAEQDEAEEVEEPRD